MTDLAAQWLAENHPEALDYFPSPDTGRNHHDSTLTDSGYWETADSRPGTRRNPAWRRAEALASQTEELAERARQAEETVGMCEQCQRRPRRAHWSKLCRTCARHR